MRREPSPPASTTASTRGEGPRRGWNFMRVRMTMSLLVRGRRALLVVTEDLVLEQEQAPTDQRSEDHGDGDGDDGSRAALLHLLVHSRAVGLEDLLERLDL